MILTEIEKILMNNTDTNDRYDLRMLLENAREEVQTSLLNKMYDQIKSYRKIDIKEIDSSKGDFIKLEFYDILEKSHNLLSSSDADIESYLNIILLAKRNIISLKTEFTKGYTLDSTVVILLYESLVYSIVDATSTLVTMSATQVVKNKDACSKNTIHILNKFNTSVENGTFRKALYNANEQVYFKFKNGKIPVKEDIIVGGFSTIIGAAIILGLIPVLREAVFYFYNIRMKISNYLDQLVMYIKINEVEVKNNPEFDASKKADIIKKQNKWIEKLEWLSDKIRVNQIKAESEAKEQIKIENKKINVDEVKKDIINKEPEKEPEQGFDF